MGFKYPGHRVPDIISVSTLLFILERPQALRATIKASRKSLGHTARDSHTNTVMQMSYRWGTDERHIAVRAVRH